MMDGTLLELRKVGHNGPIQVGHGLGRVPKGILFVSADAGCYRVNILHATRSTLKLSLTPEWELIEYYESVDNAGPVTFDHKPAQDLDCEYMLSGYWLCSSSLATTLRWRINGATTALTNEGGAYDGVAASSTANIGPCIAQKTHGSATAECYFESRIVLKSDRNRMGFGCNVQTWGTATTANMDVQTAGFKWEDTSRIYSLGIDAGGTTRIGAGSYFNLYRRPEAKGRNINLWIF